MKRLLQTPLQGERGLIVGCTGSGKTAFTCGLLEKIDYAPFVIYDTKIENKFLALPRSILVDNIDDVKKQVDNPSNDFIIFRPPLEFMSQPELLDDLLYMHYNEFNGVGAYLDEVNQFYHSRNAGKGLIGLLTRGRSRGITTIMSSQRPAGISRFCLTESQKFYVFRLMDKRDKKTIGEVVPEFADYVKPAKYGFYYFDDDLEIPELHPPQRLHKRYEVGYIDTIGSNTVVENESLDTVEIVKQQIWI